MKPYEILKIIQSKKTERAIISVLKTIPEENDFWVCAHYAFTPFTPWLFEMAFSDPEKYGSGVPEGVFEKIISAMENKSLSVEDVVFALSSFSKKCSEDEWKKWYLPTLKKNIVLPLGADAFNTVCPDRYYVSREWEPVPTRLVGELNSLPREFYIEPLHDREDTYWFCSKDGVRVFRPNGIEIYHPLVKELRGITDQLGSGIVLIGCIDCETLILNDMFLMNEFLHCDNTSMKFKARREILENIVGKLQQNIANIDVIASTPINRNDEDSIINEIKLLFQSGYGGAVFRDANQGCGYPDILVKPTTKSVLTCMDIVPGEDKHSNMAACISGRGVLNKKKILVNVLIGLTLSEREQYLKNSDSLIGERFEILSCGLRKNSNEILFPIFKQWRKK